MPDNSDNKKRIAKNTLLLYVRMLFLMLVSLYTSRVILNALGVQDFGIYNVVGGVVAMFSVISGSLSAAISRFITFELGKGDKYRLNKIFSASVTIQLLLSIIIVVLIESIGVWFLNAKMSIPANRMVAANWVFQFSIITFVINLISVPYNATIIAHEKMSAFAYISIFEGLGKLGVAFLILISPIDKLIFYSILMCTVAVSVRIMYGHYCNKHFEECDYHFHWDKEILKQMFSFAGWNFIGSSSVILRDQGVNIILNMFFGPIINAARGLSVQVMNAVNSFVQNFQTAFNPQITKSYAQKDYKYLTNLTYDAARFSAYLLICISIPLYIELPFILKLWLKTVPEYTITFVRLSLIFLILEALAKPMVTAVLASGNIKNFQLQTGGVQILNLPISYIMLKFGYAPESVFWIAIIISFLTLIQKNHFFCSFIKIKEYIFYKEVFLRVLFVTILSLILPYIVHYILINYNIYLRVCSVVIIGLSSSFFVIYFLGLKPHERRTLITKLKK